MIGASLVVSALAGDQHMRDLLVELGASDVMEKPVDYIVRKVEPAYFDKQPMTYPSSPAPAEHHEVAAK